MNPSMPVHELTMAFVIEQMNAFRERAEKAEAERDELRERSVKLEGEARIKGEFLSSRQCSDHNGKWERGRCLQCELEKATAALEGMKEQLEPIVNEQMRRAEAAELTLREAIELLRACADWITLEDGEIAQKNAREFIAREFRDASREQGRKG